MLWRGVALTGADWSAVARRGVCARRGDVVARLCSCAGDGRTDQRKKEYRHYLEWPDLEKECRHNLKGGVAALISARRNAAMTWTLRSSGSDEETLSNAGRLYGSCSLQQPTQSHHCADAEHEKSHCSLQQLVTSEDSEVGTLHIRLQFTTGNTVHIGCRRSVVELPARRQGGLAKHARGRLSLSRPSGDGTRVKR
jgi:hypothetical protein